MAFEIGSDSLQHSQRDLSRAGGEEAEAPGLVLSCKIWGLTGENYMWLSRIGSHYVFLESQAENTPFNLASIESRCRMGKGRSRLETPGKLVRGWWCCVSREKVKSSTPKTKGLQVWCKSEAFSIVPAENISGKFNFMWHPNSIKQGEMVFLLGRFAYQP